MCVLLYAYNYVGVYSHMGVERPEEDIGVSSTISLYLTALRQRFSLNRKFTKHLSLNRKFAKRLSLNRKFPILARLTVLVNP